MKHLLPTYRLRVTAPKTALIKVPMEGLWRNSWLASMDLTDRRPPQAWTPLDIALFRGEDHPVTNQSTGHRILVSAGARNLRPIARAIRAADGPCGLNWSVFWKRLSSSGRTKTGYQHPGLALDM